MAKSGVSDDVGGFAAYTGKGFKFVLVFRYLAVMLLDQQLACFDNVVCLAVKQADGFYMVLQAFFAQSQYRFRSIGYRKQFGGCFYDADIGCLC